MQFDTVVDAWVDTGQDFMDDSGGFEMGVEGSGILKPASAPHKLLGEFSEISFMYSFVGAMHMEFLLPDNVFKDNILLGTRIFGQIWPFLTNWNFISTSQVNDQICNFFYFSFLTLQMTIGSFGSFFFLSQTLVVIEHHFWFIMMTMQSQRSWAFMTVVQFSVLWFVLSPSWL